MRFVSVMMQWLVNIVLVGGLVWAAVEWKRNRRAAVLVAVACALQLAVNLLWLPGMDLVGRWMAGSTLYARRMLIWTTNATGRLATAVAFAFLFFAALGREKPEP
jgi:hypothetical protein